MLPLKPRCSVFKLHACVWSYMHVSECAMKWKVCSLFPGPPSPRRKIKTGENLGTRLEGSYNKITISIAPSYTWRHVTSLLPLFNASMVHNRNNTDSNKLNFLACSYDQKLDSGNSLRRLIWVFTFCAINSTAASIVCVLLIEFVSLW